MSSTHLTDALEHYCLFLALQMASSGQVFHRKKLLSSHLCYTTSSLQVCVTLTMLGACSYIMSCTLCIKRFLRIKNQQQAKLQFCNLVMFSGEKASKWAMRAACACSINMKTDISIFGGTAREIEFPICSP
jgi:hypothetical protein